jgi:hypothetical protein
MRLLYLFEPAQYDEGIWFTQLKESC